MDGTVESGDELKMADSTEVPPSLRWAVIKSMMNAQTHTNASLEQYLLYATHEKFDLNKKEIEVCLDEAITSQERALEDLKAARDIVQELE
jgi:hypothetical protein